MVFYDILHTIPHLRWTAEGLRYKDFCLPWSSVPNLYIHHIDPDPFFQITSDLLTYHCADSHSEFLTKHSNPLWQNLRFFVRLPFKLNEDINPTKASHRGMNPIHYALAVQELQQLEQERLIEPTSSPWACETFYVNKIAEQARDKLRLVINYQPLNHFLADDKFPIPQRSSLFQHLTKALIFFKFDLKAGFWQLGIDPADRPKTAFSIPNNHFQWTIMPFGLKNAPSHFQKAMVTIFQPILNNALIYIDDILLFSPDQQAHLNILKEFNDILHEYGIMLSKKKMLIAVT